MSYAHSHELRCHCGNLTLALATDLAADELPLRRCLCSYCTAHGNVYTSDSAGELTVHVRDERELARYRNPRSISEETMFFLVCRTCGVATAAISAIDGRDYAVLSVTSDGGEAFDLSRARDMDFDGEDLEERLARRKATWIGRVSIDVADR